MNSSRFIPNTQAKSDEKHRASLLKWSKIALSAFSSVAIGAMSSAGQAFAEGRTDIIKATIVHEDQWGTWSDWSFCPGSFPNANNAVGFRVRSEGIKQGTKDDSGTTAIELLCDNGETIKPHNGTSGTWAPNSTPHTCKRYLKNIGVTALKKRSQDILADKDNISVLRVTGFCDNFVGTDIRPGNAGLYGHTYGAERCYSIAQSEIHFGPKCNHKENEETYAQVETPGAGLCGIRVKVQNPQGGGDDTGLTGLALAWCLGPAGVNISEIPSNSRTDTNTANGDGRDVIASTTTWTKIDGCARDIAAGPDGGVWHIACDNSDVEGDGDIYWFEGNGTTNWIKGEGRAKKMAVGKQAIPWRITQQGDIFRGNTWRGTSWTKIDGCARDIAAGPDGQIWIVGCDAYEGGNSIFAWSGRDWQPVPGQATKLTMGKGSEIWHINKLGDIYKSQ